MGHYKILAQKCYQNIEWNYPEEVDKLTVRADEITKIRLESFQNIKNFAGELRATSEVMVAAHEETIENLIKELAFYHSLADILDDKLSQLTPSRGFPASKRKLRLIKY